MRCVCDSDLRYISAREMGGCVGWSLFRASYTLRHWPRSITHVNPNRFGMFFSTHFVLALLRYVQQINRFFGTSWLLVKIYNSMSNQNVCHIWNNLSLIGNIYICIYIYKFIGICFFVFVYFITRRDTTIPNGRIKTYERDENELEQKFSASIVVLAGWPWPITEYKTQIAGPLRRKISKTEITKQRGSKRYAKCQWWM